MVTKIDKNARIDRENLTAVTGTDPEETEILGLAMIYSVGTVDVPREWLLEQCDELGIPERLQPNAVTPLRAYKRAMDRLLANSDDRHFEIDLGGSLHPVKIEMDGGTGKTEIISAKIFYDEEESGVEGGDWESQSIGRFDWDEDNETLVARKHDDFPPILESQWSELVNRAEALFELMQTHHNTNDIRHIAYYLKMRYTDTVIPLRDGGSVYFVPEGDLADIVRKIQLLYERIDEKCKGGRGKVALRTLEVIDDQQRREWVRDRVETELEGMVDDVVGEVIDSFDDDSTIDEMVSMLLEDLEDSVDTAEQYNALLESKLDVEAYLEEQMAGLSGEKEEIVESALQQSSFDSF